MTKLVRKFLPIVFIALLLASCAPKTPVLFTPQQPDMGSYEQKTNNFVVLLDASSSMVGRYQGMSKFEYAKALVRMMNHTIPNIPLNGALRTFGHDKGVSTEKTKLFYGMTSYEASGIDAGLDAVTKPGGFSPMGSAILGSINDLEGLSGKSAVIIVSDGLDNLEVPMAAAQSLKDTYGNAVCIYTVAVGASPDGQMVLKELAAIGECGKSVTADDIMSPSGMAGFVSDVFLSHGMKAPMAPPAKPVDGDADGDGVMDKMDMCPGTPYGIPVDSKGCPMDSDGDGVFDTHDKCPATPTGAMVDQNGCWNIPNVMFDFDRSNIKSDALQWLNHVSEVMKLNGDLSFTVHGHTDNIGSQSYNQTLSEKRAQSVVRYLVQKGVSRSRLSSKGFNYAVPVADNDTKEGRALNRRAELVPVR